MNRIVKKKKFSWMNLKVIKLYLKTLRTKFQARSYTQVIVNVYHENGEWNE